MFSFLSLIFVVSLQATWIRNSLLHALREEANIPRTDSTDNFVYQNPTIAKLTTYIVKLVSGTSGSQDISQQAERLAAMNDMVEKYSQGFPTRFPTDTSSNSFKGYVVLITGTTGGLGSYILSALASSEEITRIYAINRPRKPWQRALDESQRNALLDRGLDADLILSSPKLRLLEADCTVPGFRLSQSVYDEVSLVLNIQSRI
jgi:hypothetical protein